ncbi:FAD-dependent monooxygenase [Patulibacter sp.]|uniref:FAD-dependent monooxygenase n=1 Tax=Patulibacter sp. TaxID=1912859 RepID=UPI00271568F5|nr:FAD-dependent monooxygenase [Patulibacter sp.]MDO9410649.1 FAD-dependent monooxygenase [Patulibacter sp.]
MDADVIVVGGGPVGLMLAGELRLAGVRPLVLERHAEVGHSPNANGLGGQIVELLRYRGLLHRFAAVALDPDPEIPGYPFGGMHLDLSRLSDPPLKGLRLQHPSVDRLLAERAVELGAEIRHGHRVVGVEQDDHAVTARVEGPDGTRSVTARFLVGCDGAHSRVRGMAGIAFPGVTYPDVHRLAEVALHPSVTVHENGDLDVPGHGSVEAGFTRGEHGVFAMGSTGPGSLMVQTIEDEEGPADDESPMTMAELGASIRRVRGVDLPLGEPRRLSRYRHEARQAETYRAGRVLLAGDAAHVLPATGIARSVGMLDAVNLAWKLGAEVRGRAPAGLLDSYHRERRHAGARAMLQSQAQVALRRGLDGAADALRELFQELLQDEAPSRRLAAMVSGSDVRYPPPGPGPGPGPGVGVGEGGRRHELAGRFVPDLVLRGADGTTTSVAELLRRARPVLLVLADRPELHDAVAGWRGRVEVHAATTDDRPADALLVRPDAHVAWAAAVGEPGTTAVPTLRESLATWFGAG